MYEFYSFKLNEKFAEKQSTIFFMSKDNVNQSFDIAEVYQ